MGFEKEGSKSGGGYVGGFFQLFDWTAKSRKKLFSSKSDLPVHSKQGKRSNENLPMTRINLVDENETGAGLSIRESSDYSCASSVTDDDGFGGRAPGVVARLMGLDSMPMSSFAEQNSTPFLDIQSLRETSQRRKHFERYHDPQIMYSGNLLNKDGPQNFPEPKPQVLSRPIEKFQTEILPPKSAKSIPVTHHKLLSPIKSHGFIPSKTAALIMEAAAKIIEPSPQATTRAKISAVGSSSVPLKVWDPKLEGAQKMPLVGSSSVPVRARDLKEKMEAPKRTSRPAEASQRPTESNAVKYLRRQPLNKSWNGSVDTTSLRSLPETEDVSSVSKNKGKSISLAIQAKVNVQRRENLNSINSRGWGGQKDQSESTSSQTSRSQLNIQKSSPKNSVHNPGGVLRQNNQKQNSLLNKDKSLKSTVSDSQVRKALSGNTSLRHKTSGKTVGSKSGARKLGLDVADSEKGSSSYGTKHIPRRKRSIDGTLHIEKNGVVDNMLIDNNQMDIVSSPVNDRHTSWAEEIKKKGMDVVSFTFTAPLTRPTAAYERAEQYAQKKGDTCMDNRGKRLLLGTGGMKLSSVGYNVIGGDALSNLLEQKLRELSNTVDSSSRNSVEIGSLGSASFIQNSAPVPGSGGTTPKLHDNKGRNLLLIDQSDGSNSSNVFSTDPSALRLKHLFQGVEEMEERSSKSNDSRKLRDCRRPSPVSVLEPSFSTESSSSLDSTDCSSTEGSKQCSFIQAQEISGCSSLKNLPCVDAEISGCSSLKNLPCVDADTDLSDSASSISNGITARKHTNTLAMADSVKSTNWEINFVHEILCNLEYMFQEFALGRACEIVNPRLFNQLECRKDGRAADSVETKLERKVIFDIVGEGLDIRCRQYVGGGYKAWIKGLMMVKRKECLAAEVMIEIVAWRGMGDCMVDELVDKDMSSQYGRWLDFEVDALSIGVEIEGQIYKTLLDEVVTDIFGC